MKKYPVLLIAGLLAFALNTQAEESGYHARKMQRLADSGKIVSVKGATPFTLASDFNSAFDAVVKALQKADETVALADRETATVATEIEIAGGWKQTGTRTIVTFIKESDKETTVKVAVTVMKRYKAIQTEPWSDPKLDADKTAIAVAKLKTALGVK